VMKTTPVCTQPTTNDSSSVPTVRRDTISKIGTLRSSWIIERLPARYRRARAVAQLAIHRTALARYEDDRRGEGGLNGSDSAARTVEHWRGVTLPMGLLYEQAAVEFWEGVVAGARVDDVPADRSRAEGDGARLASNRA